MIGPLFKVVKCLMPVEVATPALKYSDAAEGVLFLKGTYTFWAPLRDHPPPKPSFQCPHQTKKGTDMLLSEFCIHLHTHQDLKLKCCRDMGQKLRNGRPGTRDLPGTHNWLAQSHSASIFQNFTDYLMLAQSWRFGVNCCSIGLTHPTACTRARVPLAFGHVHRPPLLPNLLQRSGN